MPDSLNLEKFRRLSPFQQELVECLSVFWAPISSLELFHANVGGLPYRDMQKSLKELLALGWVTQDDKSKYRIDPRVRDPMTRWLLREGRFERWARMAQFILSPSMNHKTSSRRQRLELTLRDIRIALLRGESPDQDPKIGSRLAEARMSFQEARTPHTTLWGTNPHETWKGFISDRLFLTHIAREHLIVCQLELSEVTGVWQAARELLRTWTETDDELWDLVGPLVAWQLFARQETVPEWTGRDLHPASPFGEFLGMFAGARALSAGRPQDAAAAFDACRKALRRRVGSAQQELPLQMSLLHVLSLFLSGAPNALKAGRRIARHWKKQSHSMNVIDLLGQFLETGQPDENLKLLIGQPVTRAFHSTLAELLVCVWTRTPATIDLIDTGRVAAERARAAGLPWVEGTMAALLARLDGAPDPQEGPGWRAIADAVRRNTGLVLLADHIQERDAWEHGLEALRALGRSVAPRPDPTAGDAALATERLVWLLDSRTNSWEGTVYWLTPLMQKRTAKGWTDGRPVALKRLATEPEKIPGLTKDDQRLARAIHLSSSYYQREYEMNMNLAWLFIVNQPNLLREGSPRIPVTVRLGRPELEVTRVAGDHLRMTLHPRLSGKRKYRETDCHVEEESSNRFSVYQLSAPILKVWDILGPDGLLVPASAEAGVRATLESLAPILPIHSATAGLDEAPEVPPDSRIHVRLLPWEKGLRLLMRVLPLGDPGPAFPPEAGRDVISGEIDGRRVWTTRDPDRERLNASRVRQAAAALFDWEDTAEDLFLSSPETCLQVLEELRALGDEVIVSWPEGEKLRVTPRRDLSSLRLSMKKAGDWFSLDGELRVDEARVLSLRRLLDLVRETPGRFLPLGEGQYLALTSRFRGQLERLDAGCRADGKKGLRLDPLASVAMADLFELAEDLDADRHWKALMARVREAETLEPVVPDGLRATLRDYQVDGFRWMMRLAHWGAGAALADDMGLGKTIQALAVLLARATHGPSLVVAPLTVCTNWMEECRRFAPSLRPVFLHGAHRKRTLEHLHAGALVIASYGTLQSDIDELAGIRWGTVVLDEAQAIKNVTAKRTQAAYRLQADFRVVTTGTPIENHLGELWSLFRFLNPGLLFDATSFQERIQTPIERFGDERAHSHLKKLILPFLLRRTKAQVLQELPPRTELVRTVTLGEGERALYEALRRDAVAHIEALAASPSRHLEVLAELTRLRLAACHPRLALPDSGLPSAKLEAFGELVDELIANNHRALVFSQFVRHLTLAREWLDARQIPYLYLDGSTPVEERRDLVEDFQSGEGDLFLISLKAGGSGLNLTAADFVIHLDPWWNPAVEDQASDRAHRIGQTKPVTIYRLVSANTIEEKIVLLHGRKRELADSLLTGTDMSGQLGADDLLELIRSGD